MLAKQLLNDPNFLSASAFERAEMIRNALDTTAHKFFKDSASATEAGKIRDVVGLLHSEWYQLHVEELLERVGMHIELSGLVARLTSCRHAGLSNEKIGEIFCREYDEMSARRNGA